MRIVWEGMGPPAFPFPAFDQGSSYPHFREDIMPANFMGLPASDDATNHLASSRSFDIRVQTASSNTVPQEEHRQGFTEYGEQWDWDSDVHDYVRLKDDGTKLLYSNYQRAGNSSPSSAQPASDHDETKAKAKTAVSADTKTVKPRTPAVPLYDQPLGDDFQVVAKPKRFFTVGRIFKAVWFEPGGPPATTDPSSQPKPSNGNEAVPWSTKCPGFHGEKPIARFRWFIVVRRRLHYSLCFSITTYSGGGGGGGGSSNNNGNTSGKGKVVSTAASRGRPGDYVVLHLAGVKPARPYDEEEITRDPIGVIIEDEEQYISPIARLDCGRIYTVEDSLRVSKVGRVHPSSLGRLEEYYRECVE